MTSARVERSGGLRAGLRRGRTSPRSDRRELIVALLLGAAGAGLRVPRQPAAGVGAGTYDPAGIRCRRSRVTVTGAALVPYADALAVAGLATLAAVLASRVLARRLDWRPARRKTCLARAWRRQRSRSRQPRRPRRRRVRTSPSATASAG